MLSQKSQTKRSKFKDFFSLTCVAVLLSLMDPAFSHSGPPVVYKDPRPRKDFQKIVDESEYVYDAENKTDPFASFIVERERILSELEAERRKKFEQLGQKKALLSELKAAKTELQKIDISQLSLTGIVDTRKKIWAMVKDPKGRGHVLTKGTFIGTSPQFELVEVQPVQEERKVGSRAFSQNAQLRRLIVGEMQSDVYVFGRITSREMSQVICQFQLYDHKGEPILTDDVFEFTVQANLTPSGYRFFTRVLAEILESGREELKGTGTAEVLFLTQPISDETNPWWEAKDGLIYRKSEEVSFTPDFGYGAIMKSHIKTYEDFMGTGHAVAKFGLMLQLTGKEPVAMENYVLPKKSEYYYLLDEKGTEYRFEYLWHYAGKGTVPGPHLGVGWKFFMAQQDWVIQMPIGSHGGMAYLEPVSQKLFGATLEKPDYYKRFRFVVKPGLNVYVINYAHHADQPKIFIKRLEFSKGPQKTATRTVKEIKVSNTVYGSD